MPVARAALLLISALGLAGCETGSNLFAGGGDSTTPLAAATQPPAEQRAKMAVAPIVGPPDATSRALQTQVVAALEVLGMVREGASAEVRLPEPVALDHRAHGPVQDEDPLGEEALECVARRHLGIVT